MAGTYRHQTLIDAPVEDVWAVIRDPLTHPDWWPDVVAVWVAERLEDLKEARFRCTVTGTWAHFKLTPAQAETFVELETGMDPTKLRWRLMKTTSGSFFKGWILDVQDALPQEVVARQIAAPE